MMVTLAFAALSAMLADNYQIAAYYYPGYHPDPLVDARKGKGWTEWELVKAATPRFPGHVEPKVSLWGYEDEADPKAMAKKIDAAADHGITAFLFDWYWYNDAPYLERALDDAFLKAKNRNRIKFALMWANHDWLDCQPAYEGKPMPLIYSGGVTREVFDHATGVIIKRYFSQPNYWRFGGKPYFSIYEVWTLVKGLGGLEKTREALDSFRERARAAGLPGIHLNAVGWGELTNEMATALGFDSVTTYSWIHHVGLPENTPYEQWARSSIALWPKFRERWKPTYFPNVSMNWDNTPRFNWAKAVTGNTPAEFKKALLAAKAFLDSHPGPKVLTINAWNEWTEGSYLEPDTVNKLGYLEAVRDVFKSGVPGVREYADGRPAAMLRMDATDEGVVLRHGDGPGGCDTSGAREAIVFEHGGTYYLHYDGAGPDGWRACLATSKDLKHWTKRGPILDLGKPGEDDSASAAAPWVYFDGTKWHMFYVATPNASPPPDRIPAFPYLTRKAKSDAPGGPWTKERDVIPFQPKAGTYYADTASPGQVVKQGDEFLMFFSGSMPRTLGIARTKDLDGTWTLDPQPIVPPAEQIEDSSLYFEPSNKTWFLFTNHIGVDARGEYTDSIWVYWSKDINRWDSAHKAVVLDGVNCRWSSDCIGMPSVVKVGNRLALLYDAPGGCSVSHVNRDIGLAWLKLPLNPPSDAGKRRADER